ncbi:MAG: peptide chain release factor 2 [Actinomycetota bacterium]|nr:peptide chain release factor 2 [Actinomycetota bacterium]
MVTDFGSEIEKRLSRLKKMGSIFEVESSRPEIEKLRKLSSSPDFWEDQENARKLMSRLSRLDDKVSLYDRISSHISELGEMNRLGLSENDPSFEPEIENGIVSLDQELNEIERNSLLTGEFDRGNAIVSLHPGAGGLESQDWAAMLLRMYLRWAGERKFEVDLNDVQPGEGAGVKSATFTVKGEYAYGLLSVEKGVHRLVRISPFDFSKRRHTSFVSLDVIPEVGEEIEIEIDPKDLRVDTFHSSGAGGQHVNVTDSAVRVTHLPTGMVVQCQNERSQTSNKTVAMRILKSRLFELERKKKEEEIQTLRGERKDIAWGNQIRSYIFQPYQLVKDHRTGLEKGNVQAVMDGEIEEFIEEALRWRKAGNESGESH